ncbi:PerC family transcriptional regulator, partial [Escherichia coli]
MRWLLKKRTNGSVRYCQYTSMGNVECTEAQREWLLLRRNYCLAQISSPPLPEKLDISEVAKAADATLRRMGI